MDQERVVRVLADGTDVVYELCPTLWTYAVNGDLDLAIGPELGILSVQVPLLRLRYLRYGLLDLLDCELLFRRWDRRAHLKHGQLNVLKVLKEPLVVLYLELIGSEVVHGIGH